MEKGFLLKKKTTGVGQTALKTARVIFIPEAHEDFQMKLEIGRMLMEKIVEPQSMKEKGITKISLVSEGEEVNPIFEGSLLHSEARISPETIKYISNNLLVEGLDNKNYKLEISKKTIKTLKAFPNVLVDFITHFFQNYGTVVYQMVDDQQNTKQYFEKFLNRQGIQDIDYWWNQGNDDMIRHLEQSIQYGLIKEEGVDAAKKIIGMLLGFKSGGITGFYGNNEENYITSITILIEILHQITLLVDTDNIAKAELFKMFVEKIKQGLEYGVANPQDMKNDKKGFNVWRSIYLTQIVHDGKRNIKPFMKLINLTRDQSVIKAMEYRMGQPNPPELFILIFGAAHLPMTELIKKSPNLILDDKTTKEICKKLNYQFGGIRPRRRRKKRTMRKKRTRRKKSRRRRKTKRRRRR